MKKILLALVLLVLAIPITDVWATKPVSKAEKLNEKRVKDAIIMARMIEYFKKKTGHYPASPEKLGKENIVIITKNKEFIPENTYPYEKLQQELFDILGNKAVLAMDPEDNKKQFGRYYRYRTDGQDYWFSVFLTSEKDYTKTEGKKLYKVELTSRQSGDKFQYSIRSLKHLMKFGKDNKRMQKSLFEAMENDMYDWALELITQGANLNSVCRFAKDCQPLAFAAKEGNTDKIKFLLKYGAEIDGINSYGDTPLMKALDADKLNAAEFLIEAGANVNAPNAKGLTPFIVAILTKRHDLVNLMLEKGADVNRAYVIWDENDTEKKGSVGVKPLEVAIQAQDTKLVKLLLEKGANPKAKTVKGAPLLEYAKKLENKEIVKLLEDAIAKAK